MVNWVEAQKHLFHFLAKTAGLRHQTVEIEPGTVMSFWVPKAKHEKKKKNSSNKEVDDDTKKKGEKEKPAVVLVHGFAAEGIATWLLQVGSLTSRYAVYVPDLLFFGGSVTASADRSPGFQARCIITGLGRLGVGRFTAVGFSYGGMVAFKMAEARPELLDALVVSGSVVALTDAISREALDRLGFSSWAELLLPETLEGLKALFSVGTYKKLWFPDRLYKDCLKVMFDNRKEKKELLEGLVISKEGAKVPILPQMVLLLWGENDRILNMKLAEDMKKQLGEKATLQGIKKAGHLVHLERPRVYNRCLKQFLAQVHDKGNQE
ncbi:uncharacterized protein [Elaeis guineensis]|uniref:Monoacylglycerol lipase ABHD6 n=1 Tax=Elaeis guineensis var. tenera TaxID=51953 RepID=A0A6I9RCA7_ELAGV|nr:monoacylglycerol lipase ABHD6 [Elaeis guineensis]